MKTCGVEKTSKMDWNKIERMAEQHTLYLLLKEQGLAISLDTFKALCDKAKKAAHEAVEQEQRYGDKRQSTLLL